MIISQTVTTRWNISNKNHYENLGYHFTKYGDPLLVNADDLPEKSKVRVVVECDICGMKWKTRRSIVTDICRRCKLLEQEDIWTKEDLEILKQYATVEDPAELLDKFSTKRTPNAIAIKARREGIKRVKWKQTPENPFKFNGIVSPIEAMLFGYHLGDGSLSQTKQGNGFSYSCEFSGDYEGLTNIKMDIKNQFGIDLPAISQRETESTKYDIEGTTNELSLPITIAKHLLLLDTPIGKKVEVPFQLPDWLMKGEILLKEKFLSGLYCAEGDTLAMQVNDITAHAPAFLITKRKVLADNFEILLAQIGQLLNDVGIAYSLKKTFTVTCAENIKATFTIKNSNERMVMFCQMMDFSYSPRKGMDAKTTISAYCLLKLMVGNSAKKVEKSLWALEQLKTMDKQIATLVMDIAGKYKDQKFTRILPADFPKYKTFCQMAAKVRNETNDV